VDGNETDPAKVGEASEADPAVHHAGTTTTAAGTTTTTTTETPPASIDPPPPPLVDDLTKVALPIAEPKEVDGSETDPAIEVDGNETDPAKDVEASGTTTTHAGTTTTTATEAPPASIDPPPPPLGDELTKQALRHALPKAMDSIQTPNLVATTATGKTPLKVSGQKRKYAKRAKVPVAQIAFKDELFEGDVQQVHGWRSQSRRELWQRGHQTASRSSRIAHEVLLVMCDTVKECHTSMRMHGWAILRDMTNAFGPKQQCTEQQRAFIDDYTIDGGLEVVFEDVIMNDRVDHYTSSFDKEHVNARVQLDMGRTGFQDIRAMYTRKYEEQLKTIIGGYDLFEGDTSVPFEGVPELAPATIRKEIRSCSD
jgi:hypothetical protein